MEAVRAPMTVAVVVSRLFQLALSLIPAFTGIFAFLNNIVGSGTPLITEVIKPLLSMTVTNPEYAHSWRAIHSETLAKVAYFIMLSGETIVGVLAIVGIVKMLMGFTLNNYQFACRQAWVRAACVWGFLVWGLGFYTIGGDFFLAWQNPNLSSLQSGGLNYVLMMAVPYFFLKMHEMSSTV